MTDNRSDLETMIAGRQLTHGDFRDVSKSSQDLCEVMQRGKNWGHLRPYAQEGLEMIQHKVSRILSGDPFFLDHWEDIAGYATRVKTIIEEDRQAMVK